MAITQVFTYRPRPGGIEQFMTLAKRADKILRALGATTRTLTRVAGGTEATAFIYLIETPNWKAHGDLSAKLETDADWRKFVDEVGANPNPAVDMISSAVYSELPLG
jgi:hypothetical protein